MMKLLTANSPVINRQTVTTTIVAAASKAAMTSNLFVLFQIEFPIRLEFTDLPVDCVEYDDFLLNLLL